MRKYRTLALSAVALGALLSAGCGPSTTNDENLTGNKPTSGTGGGGAKNYGEFATKQNQKDASRLAKDAKAAKGKGIRRHKPETPKEEPQSQ